MTPKRKEYLRKYRLQNRERLYASRRVYYAKHREEWGKYRKPIIPIGQRYPNGMAGTNGLGREYELLALKYLAKSVDMNSTNFRGKWDIEWEGKRIDVKVRKRKTRKSGLGFYHFTSKPNPKATDYLLFCLNGDAQKVMLVPSSEFGKKKYPALTISEKDNRLDKYLINNFPTNPSQLPS